MSFKKGLNDYLEKPRRHQEFEKFRDHPMNQFSVVVLARNLKYDEILLGPFCSFSLLTYNFILQIQ